MTLCGITKQYQCETRGDALRYAAARIHSPPKMPAGTGAVAFRSVFAFGVLQTCNKPLSAISRTAGIPGMTRRDKLRRAQPSCPAPGVKFRPAQFHIMASQPPCVGRKLRPQQAWVHSEGNRGCISWPLSGPSEPPCRTAAIDRSCTTCAARGRSGSSVTADKPVRVKASRSAWPVNSVVDKEDYRQMLSRRGGEGGAIDDW